MTKYVAINNKMMTTFLFYNRQWLTETDQCDNVFNKRMKKHFLCREEIMIVN